MWSFRLTPLKWFYCFLLICLGAIHDINNAAGWPSIVFSVAVDSWEMDAWALWKSVSPSISKIYSNIHCFLRVRCVLWGGFYPSRQRASCYGFCFCPLVSPLWYFIAIRLLVINTIRLLSVCIFCCLVDPLERDPVFHNLLEAAQEFIPSCWERSTWNRSCPDGVNLTGLSNPVKWLTSVEELRGNCACWLDFLCHISQHIFILATARNSNDTVWWGSGFKRLVWLSLG